MTSCTIFCFFFFDDVDSFGGATAACGVGHAWFAALVLLSVFVSVESCRRAHRVTAGARARRPEHE